MVLVISALSMMALFGFLALAIDLGRIAFTANEVQTVADIAATAGAKALADVAATAGPDGLLQSATKSSAQSQAQTVARENRVDGAGATIEAGQIEVLGQYNPQDGTFSGAPPYYSVRATPSATVQNLFAGIFGASYQNSTVTKTATAGLIGLGKAKPTLPLALGECNFQEGLPSLTRTPSNDGAQNSGWTSFFDNSASTSSITGYMPSACGGGGQTIPDISVGDSINLQNGDVPPLENIVKSCLSQTPPMNQFLIPIVKCSGSSNFNQLAQVTGFATIVIEPAAEWDGKKGMDLQAIFKAVSGPAGGGAFGTYTVRLLS
jgi:hypothetical protein